VRGHFRTVKVTVLTVAKVVYGETRFFEGPDEKSPMGIRVLAHSVRSRSWEAFGRVMVRCPMLISRSAHTAGFLVTVSR